MVKNKQSRLRPVRPRGGHGNFSGGLGPNVPKDLRTAVGPKGQPLTIAQTVSGANPYYSRVYSEYSENCQRCVVAYELRRRGYNVTALPTYRGDRLPQIAYVNPSTGSRLGRWMGAFQGAVNEHVGVGGRNGESATIKALSDKMKSYGNGSRGVVQVFWKNGGGHVFSVENVKGKMVYSDAQTGKTVNIRDYMGDAITSTVDLIRTDNLRISNRARNYVAVAR